MPQIILPDLEVSGVFPSPRRFTTWVAGRRTLIVLNQAIATYVTQWTYDSHNTDLRIARMKIDEAVAMLTASRLAFLPSVNMSADGSVSKESGNKFNIGPSASWELDIFGKQRNLKKGAEAAFYGSEVYRQAVQAIIALCHALGGGTE